MPKPQEPQTLYDSLGAFDGGVNAGDSPLDLPKNVMASAINVTVSGKNASHRPAYYRRTITFPSDGGTTQNRFQTGVFQGQTEDVVLDDSGNAYLICLISGRVFSLAIGVNGGISGSTANSVYCTELPIYSTNSSPPLLPISGGTVTGAKVSNATVTGANITVGATIYTGTITGGTITGATLNGQLITAGTVSGVITSTANVATTVAGASFATPAGTTSAGYIITGTITGVTVTGGTQTGPASVVQPQAWLWQSECWVIIQDGSANPIVVNLNTQVAVRSNYGNILHYSTTTSTGAAVAPVGATFTITFASVANLVTGQLVTIQNTGTFTVGNISGTTVTLQTVTGNGVIQSGQTVYWKVTAGGIPPGRMGAYGLQRNWFSLVLPTQFFAGDLSGGASGSAAFDFRDAVLMSTENTFIVGGGNFSVPGGNGPITSIKFMSQPNTVLGQGPLIVSTHKSMFTCQAPVDRLTWQSLTNPILTESVIGYGAKGQWSTRTSNSDMFFRAVDGIRSVALYQLQQSQWGTTSCSFEVSTVLGLDNLALVQYESSVVFNNRQLFTVGPVQSAQGVYHTAIIPLNYSPISSLRGKAPSVWDSLTWVGGGAGSTNQMQAFQLSVGEVNSVERCFAMVLNTTASPNQIELWEILADGAAIADNDGTNSLPITWTFDSGSMRFGVPNEDHQEMQLSNGELWLQNINGTISVEAFYKPDQFPKFQPWIAYQCKQTSDAPNSQAAYAPRQGLGQPPHSPANSCYDPSTGRPFFQAFTFQFRLAITGHAVFLGSFFEATTIPMRKFAPVINQPLP